MVVPRPDPDPSLAHATGTKRVIAVVTIRPEVGIRLGITSPQDNDTRD